MKKHLLALSCLLLCTYATVLAKDQVTIRVSPGLAFGRVYADPERDKLSSNGLSFGGKICAMYDWNIKDNYFLCGGLAYSAQQVGVKGPSIQEKHHIQYLQLPVLLKLYTSELDLDLRGYAEIGFFGAIKINDRTTDLGSQKETITKINRLGAGAILGVGVEYNLSLFTTIFGGISYQLGFNSAFGEQQANANSYIVRGYQDLLTVDIGIGF